MKLRILKKNLFSALHTAVLLRNPKLVRRYSLAMKIFNIPLEVRNRNGEVKH